MSQASGGPTPRPVPRPVPRAASRPGRLAAWRADASLRGVLRNAGLLVSGKGAGAVLHLLGLSLAARALGPEAFGALVLINTYALTATGLTRFQSWQAVIQFGTPALHGVEQRGADRQGLADVLLFALALDLGTGLLGMAGAMALLPALAPRLDIPEATVGLALLYATLIPTMSIATPAGVLRLLDRYDLMAWQSTVLPALRLAGVVLAWALGAPFWAYLLCWWLSDLAGDLVLMGLAWRELRRRGLLAGTRPRWGRVLRPGAGMWRFVCFTNLGSSLAVAWGPLSNLLVGAALGREAAGLFRVAQTVTEALAKPADLLSRVFYPEAARLREAARSAEFWRLSARSAALAGLAALVAATTVAALAGPFVALFFGAGYAPAAELLRVMALSLLLTVPAFPLEPLLLTLGRAGTVLAVRAAATGGYVALLVLLARGWGLDGAAAAYVGGAAAMVAAQAAAVATARRWHGQGVPPAAPSRGT